LRFEKPLTGRVIEENSIVLRFPDCRELHRPRAVQAIVDSARLSPSQKKSLGHLESTELELIVVAKNLVYEVADVIQTAKLQNARNHLGWDLLAVRENKKGRTFTLVRENGVSANRKCYRQIRTTPFTPSRGILGSTRDP
jgi:hypothetical protein